MHQMFTVRKIIPCVSILEAQFQQLGLLSHRIPQKFRQNWLGGYLQTVYFKVPKVGSQIHQNLDHESQQFGVLIMSPNSWEFRSHIRERKTQLALDSQMLGENSKKVNVLRLSIHNHVRDNQMESIVCECKQSRLELVKMLLDFHFK